MADNIQEYVESLTDTKVKGFVQAVSQRLIDAEKEITELKTQNADYQSQIETLNTQIEDLTIRVIELEV